MGYYTDYEVSVKCGDMDFDLLGIRLSDITGYSEFNDDLNAYSIKWYDHNKDMLAISKEFPDVVFKLHGEGEEQPDLWDKYYKNGKMQECVAVIVYPPYDESKLK